MTSSFATVFAYAEKFNADLSSWDVSRVTDMENSKSCALFASLIR
jgi:surface protein